MGNLIPNYAIVIQSSFYSLNSFLSNLSTQNLNQSTVEVISDFGENIKNIGEIQRNYFINNQQLFGEIYETHTWYIKI